MSAIPVAGPCRRVPFDHPCLFAVQRFGVKAAGAEPAEAVSALTGARQDNPLWYWCPYWCPCPWRLHNPGVDPAGGKVCFTSWVDSLAFSPDFRYLAAGDSDSSLRIWSTTNWRELATLHIPRRSRESCSPQTSAASSPWMKTAPHESGRSRRLTLFASPATSTQSTTPPTATSSRRSAAAQTGMSTSGTSRIRGAPRTSPRSRCPPRSARPRASSR